jgi:hypothetical protein
LNFAFWFWWFVFWTFRFVFVICFLHFAFCWNTLLFMFHHRATIRYVFLPNFCLFFCFCLLVFVCAFF